MVEVKEAWKPVVGWEGFFEVSNCGRVRSLSRRVRDGSGVRTVLGHLMACTINRNGYVVTQLSDGKRKHKVRVNVLVLEAFAGLRPTGKVCRHFPNRNPADNRLENLSWGTHKENAADRAVHGTENNGERNGGAKLTRAAIELMREDHATGGYSLAGLSRKYGVCKTQVWRIVNRRKWGND